MFFLLATQILAICRPFVAGFREHSTWWKTTSRSTISSRSILPIYVFGYSSSLEAQHVSYITNTSIINMLWWSLMICLKQINIEDEMFQHLKMGFIWLWREAIWLYWEFVEQIIFVTFPRTSLLILYGCFQKYGKTLQIIHFNRVFHYFHHPFWGFPPYFWKHPYVWLSPPSQSFWWRPGLHTIFLGWGIPS